MIPKFARFVSLYGFLAIVVMIFTAESCESNKEPTGAITKVSKSQVDSIINATVTKKLKEINFSATVTAKQQGYLIDTNPNSAVFMVGSLYELIESANGGKASFNSVMDFNYLNSPKNLSSTLLSSGPDFDTYVNSGFTTDVAAFGGKLDLGEDESAHVRYETIISAAGTGNYLDHDKIDKDSKDYDFRKIKNPVIISQVMIKKLSYTKFKKLKGDLEVTSAIVNVNGSMYYQTGSEINVLEVYVFKTDLRLKANGIVDTVKISKPPVFTDKVIVPLKVEDLKTLNQNVFEHGKKLILKKD